MRSRAEGEHRTGEDAGAAFTLAAWRVGAMRRKERDRRAIHKGRKRQARRPSLPASATTRVNEPRKG